VAPHVRPHLDGIDGGRPGGEVRVVGDVALNGITDQDRHGRNTFGRGRGLRATGKGETAAEQEAACAEWHVDLAFLTKEVDMHAVPTSGPFGPSRAKGPIPGRANARRPYAAARSGRQPPSGRRRNRRS